MSDKRKEDVVTYDRISQDPTKFEDVFKRQLSLADELRSGKVEPDRGNVEGKALHGATRTLETDLRSRIFEHRVRIYEDRSKTLPNPGERSSGKQITDKRSRASTR